MSDDKPVTNTDAIGMLKRYSSDMKNAQCIIMFLLGFIIVTNIIVYLVPGVVWCITALLMIALGVTYAPTLNMRVQEHIAKTK